MKHITIREDDEGRQRHYFRRRGVPLLRLFGSPDEPEFITQYEKAAALRPRSGSWANAEKRAIQAALKGISREGQIFRAASRLARSVNNRAKHQYHVESEITTKWILERIEKQGGRCAVSGLPFCYKRGLATKDRRNPFAPSVDRIDCSKGYTRRNCRLVILAVNVALNLWGDDLFLGICKATVERVHGTLPPMCVTQDEKS